MSVPWLLISATIAASPQEEQKAVFRVSTEAVQVDVFVGKDGRAIPGLRPVDFEIYDDGELREIDSVAVEEMPLNVVLVLDTSLSVAGATLRHLQDAAAAFLDDLSPDDRAGVVTFSHHLSLRSGLTSELAPLKSALEDVEAEGGTAWQDALFSTLEILEVVRERPMVLLFTDGADTYSWLTEEQVSSAVDHSNAVIYAITRDEKGPMPNLGTMRAQERYREARREHSRRTSLLRELTEESGGRLLETSSSDRLEEVFLEILAEMKTRYILTYMAPGPVREGWHPLEVKVKRKGVDVHARRGYFYQARN